MQSITTYPPQAYLPQAGYPQQAGQNTPALADKAQLRDPKIWETAQDFEAVFLSQMLAPMMEGVGNDALMGGGPSEEIFRGMMIEEIGKEVARSGGIGIADNVYREILKLQEASNAR